MRKAPVMRVARPTDNLAVVSRMYAEGLGLEVLGSFESHDGFDGVILGSPGADYHIEFTSAHHEPAGGAPSPEHLLVFYIEDRNEWRGRCEAMLGVGFAEVKASNPYWERYGRSFADADGYRVVLCNSA